MRLHVIALGNVKKIMIAVVSLVHPPRTETLEPQTMTFAYEPRRVEVVTKSAGAFR